MSNIIISIDTEIYKDELEIDISKLPEEEIKTLLKEHKDYLKILTDSSYKIVNYFISEKKVPDVWRYTISKQAKEFLLEEQIENDKRIIKESKFRDIEAASISEKSKSIVLILESPHKDEYSKDFKPLVPAHGATGTHIRKYLCEDILPIMEKDFSIKFKGTYNLILSNPIQYQTSLHEILKKPLSNKTVKKLRDKIWDSIFNIVEFKKDFEDRLLFYNPEIIINGCTSSLKGKVTEFLEILYTEETNCTLFKTPHPSSWYITRHRKLTL